MKFQLYDIVISNGVIYEILQYDKNESMYKLINNSCITWIKEEEIKSLTV